jgi:hypothetical protein
MSGTIGYDELRAATVRQVAQLMAAAAITGVRRRANLRSQESDRPWGRLVQAEDHLVGQFADDEQPGSG